MRNHLKLENLYKKYARSLYFYLFKLSGSHFMDAINTGEFVDFDPNGWGGGYNMIMVDAMGLTGGVDHDEDYHQNLQITVLNQETVKESKRLMLKNIEELLGKPESYYSKAI